MIESAVESVSILGIPVDRFESYEHLTEVIRRRVQARRKTFCVAINPEKVQRAKRDRRLREALESAHIRICDGTGVALASLLLDGRRLVRCTGIELFFRLIGLSAQEGWKVFLLGASAETNALACGKLRRSNPGLNIAGSRDGFFRDSAEVIQQVNGSGADLLFVAMGSPRQELWIAEHMAHLTPCFCMGVGGTLDVVAGTARWAPALFRKTGTEWLFRLLTQPSRARRQLALPLYAVDVLKAVFAR